MYISLKPEQQMMSRPLYFYVKVAHSDLQILSDAEFMGSSSALIANSKKDLR